MALPVTIGSSSIDKTAPQNSYHGPFKSSGGAFYTILNRADSSLGAWKATDPTDSFAEQDATTRPVFVSPILSLNVFQDGDDLHVAGQTAAGVSDNVYYARFDMASDVWDTPDGTNEEEQIANPNTTLDACDIVVLSTGKIRVVYQGPLDMDMGTNFERVDENNSTDGGENWSAPTQVDNGASVAGLHYNGPRIVLPPSNSDQCYIFMIEGSTSITTRGIASDDSLRTYRDTTRDVDAQGFYNLAHGVGISRSSQSKVRVAYQDDNSDDPEVLKFDAETDDTAPTFGFNIITTDNVDVINNSVVLCLAVDGSTIHGFMAKTDGDLFPFDDDNSDTYTLGTEHLAGSINHISCNVYDRSGTKLAMIYDDGGTVQYDEIDLGGGPAAGQPMARRWGGVPGLGRGGKIGRSW